MIRARSLMLSLATGCCASLIAVLFLPALTLSADPQADFEPLRKRLIADGLPPETVNALFDDERFELVPELLRINVKQRDVSDVYKAFAEPASVRRTRAFLDEHKTVFDKVLEGSPVEPEVVAAVLRIESNFGEYPGRYPLMNVFASLTMLESNQLETLSPEFWEHCLEGSDPDERDEVIRKVNRRKKRKADWAYKELTILVEMAAQEKMDPLEIRGSWAGAFGLAQFLPSSFQTYARDGNLDDITNLYHLEDAIASIAHYLALHGYNTENVKKRRRAVWHYNHSDDYVTAVLTLADKVKTAGKQ